MERAAGEFGAIHEAVVFLDYFKDLSDPRQLGKVTYPLGEVLLLCLLAVLGGAETFVDIERFGEKKRGLLRRFRLFDDGAPAHDHLATYSRRSMRVYSPRPQPPFFTARSARFLRVAGNATRKQVSGAADESRPMCRLLAWLQASG